MYQPNNESTSLADADLVERTRRGDTSSYAELWRRHADAGRAAARSFTTSFDADDLVSEAFTRVFRSIKAGGGPTTAFRAYLVRTVRNLAISWHRAAMPDSIEEADQLPDPRSSESARDASLDRLLTADAFRSLPERWRQVLWYSEVEALKPRDIAPLLGISPNSVSALIYRAREALRQAWIQSHLVAQDAGSEHGWTIERLGSYSREKLAGRDRVKVQAHLAGCSECSKVAVEARRVAAALPWQVLPSVGSVGAAARVAPSAIAPATIASPREPLLARTARRLERISTGGCGMQLVRTAAVATISLVAAAALMLPTRAPAPVSSPVQAQAAPPILSPAATPAPPREPPPSVSGDPGPPRGELDPALHAGDSVASASPGNSCKSAS